MVALTHYNIRHVTQPHLVGSQHVSIDACYVDLFAPPLGIGAGYLKALAPPAGPGPRECACFSELKGFRVPGQGNVW